MNEFDLNKYSFCLSCNIDRYHYVKKCFEYLNIHAPALFPGIAHPKSGAEGCKLGHLGIMMLARCFNLPYVFVYEDDAYPRRDYAQKLNIIIDELKIHNIEWGMLSLGRNGDCSGWDANPELFWAYPMDDANRKAIPHRNTQVTENIISIPKNPHGSHAYLVKRCCFNEWIASLVNNKYVDIAMGAQNFRKNNIYWTKELLVTTKQIDTKCMSGIGNIKNCFMYPHNYNVDYTGIVHFTDIPPKGFDLDLFSK